MHATAEREPRAEGDVPRDAVRDVVPPTLRHGWRLPVLFVMSALVLLLGAPIVVNFRVRRLREQDVDISDSARVVVNDLEAAYATELYLRGVRDAGDPRADRLARRVAAAERVDERALDSLARRLGPEVSDEVAGLRRLAAAWHGAHPIAATAVAAPASGGDGEPLHLTAAESLERDLTARSAEAREGMRRLQREEIAFTIVLVPVALAAMGVVLVTGQRMLALARAVERDRVALAQALVSRTSLIYGVTHDIRNPLGAARGYTELLLEASAGALSGEQSRMVQRVHRLLESALQTVSDLLDVARADSGRLHAERAPVDLGALAGELRDDYAAAARAKRLTLCAEPAAHPVLVATDAARVRRILGNLLSNAIKYTPAGGHVTLTVECPAASHGAPRVGVAVHDDGPGVPAPLRERIFDEFFRAPGVEHSSQGTGLGLAVSRRFARSLGGDIEVRDGVPGGAVFTLWLPDDGATSRAVAAD